MFETVHAYWQQHETLLTWVAWGSGVMLLVSLLSLPVIAVLLPADFLARAASCDELAADDWRRRHPVLRWTLRVLKNIAGGLLAIAGLAMLILPGQGLLTLAVAVLLLDLPGKRRLEQRLLKSPRLRGLLNRMRRWFGRAELVAPVA